MHSESIHSAVVFAPLPAPRPRTWRRWVLGAFLLLSTLLHGSLLLLPSTPPVVQAGGKPGAIQVRMQPIETVAEPTGQRIARTEKTEQPAESAQPAAAPQPDSTAKPAPAAQPRPVATKDRTPAPAPEDTAAAASSPAPAAGTPAHDPSAATPPAEPPAPEQAVARSKPAAAPAPTRAPDPIPREALQKRLRDQLGDSLRAHFHYPRIARHRGWEGLVEVGLRVEANGRLSDIRILRTSGYSVLDRAALASVGRIQRLREASQWLGGQHIDLVLPVQYRLIDG